MISRCLVFILFCLAATVAKAADVFPSNAEGCDYHLRGQIVSGGCGKAQGSADQLARHHAVP